MSKNKFTDSFNGKGYYIALILCAVAIGISGYLFYRNANEPEDSLQNTEPVAATSDQVDDLPADATQPVGADPVATEPVQITEPVGAEPSQDQAPAAMQTVWPVDGELVSGYAMDALSYNQTTRDWRTHNGIDLAAETGTAVVSAADGTVYTVYEDDTMGMCVVVSHENGYTTTYSSLSDQVEVAAGDPVTAGQTIGYVGTTALLETAIADHVHFSVTCDGEDVDPLDFLPEK